MVSTLSLTRLQLSGTNSLFLSIILPRSSFNSSLKTCFLETHFFSPITLIYKALRVCVCVRACALVSYALNFENMHMCKECVST